MRREVTDVLLRGIAAAGTAPGMRFQLILSAGGNGKSVLLLRLQYELAQAGEYVLIPTREGADIAADALATVCQAVATDPQHSGRRVFLLLDNAYRFHGPLLADLTTYPIDNLTLVATDRYTAVAPDSPRPAPALVTSAGAPAPRATYEALDLDGLGDDEASI